MSSTKYLWPRLCLQMLRARCQDGPERHSALSVLILTMASQPTDNHGDEVNDSNRADEVEPEGVISRTSANEEDGCTVRLYRDRDRLLTYDELCASLKAEAATVDPEQWIDGEFIVGEYIIEACLVGLYELVDVVATVVNGHTGLTVMEYRNDDDEVVAERLVVET